MRDRYHLWRRIILAVVLLCLILTGFFVYLHTTRNMTLERNANYVADAANQTAKRIDDLLVGAENSISAIAHMYERSLDPKQADVETLDQLTRSTVFDYIGFVNAEGIYTDNRGLQADVSDRDYVQDGLKGNTGMDMIFNGRVSGEDLVIFYVPLRLDGEVVGILTGRYRQQQMREIITSSYFGEPANTYLCLSDGTVIASSVEKKPENILDTLNQNAGSDKNALKILTNALSTGSSASFTYTNSYGSSAAYVTKLPHSDWMMLQVFPMQVTNEMLGESGAAATYLLLWLVILSALYILLLLLESHKEKVQLTSEKQQMQEIVSSTSRLFSRFILADLEHDTYTILTNNDLTDESQLPDRGIYSDLCASWNDRILDEEASEYDKEQFSVPSIQEHLTEDIPYLQYENRIQDGGIRWKQISVLCLKREQGIPTSVLLAVQDVTELKELEQRNRVALEDAYQSARAANDVKRTFLFDMSHDMRTPMNAIIGLSGLLDRDAGDPERVRSYSQKIHASGQQLLALINEILDMSKIESGKTTLKLAPFSLSELLEELTVVFQTQAQAKEQTFQINAFGVTQERLLGDKLHLCEILNNLLSNAIKYTAKGGRVAMVVRGLPQTTKGYVHLLFEITDNGIGMKPEFVQHIFEPFFRENNSTISGIQGAGLGMTITKSLVDLMGGTISVESVPGQGSTFKVELELRLEEEVSEGCCQSQPEEKDLSLEELRLLVVEDNDINAEILMELLDMEGAICERAVNGREAVTLFQSKPVAYYDGVLMDIQMPEMNGYEAAQTIRALTRDDAVGIPIVAMTANTFAEDVQKSMEAGMNAHIAKPVDLKVLKSVLSKLH